jgi:hypothetical protein
VKIRGRSVYMDTIEAKLGLLPGIKPGRLVAIAPPGPQALVAIAEAEPGDWVEPAMQLLRRETSNQLEIRLLSAPRGTIMKTSSGKPRRRVMWRRLLNGGLPATALVSEFKPPSKRRRRATSEVAGTGT